MKLIPELMVPLKEYATVSVEATLKDAVTALKQSQAYFDKMKYRHRAILIYDNRKRIVGKVTMLSILMGLEPKYDQMLSDKGPAHVGFTRIFQKSMIEQLKLWEDPLEHVCEKGAHIKVKSFMTPLKEGEFIEIHANLNEAIHQLVLGHHQSLMVTENDRVVGVLRLTDVFDVVADAVLA
jgi:CBS domain containing-hemolysin-like protein